MKHRFRWFLLAACLWLGTAAPAAERLVPGQWRFTMTTAGETRNLEQCITAAKAAEVNGDSKSGREAAEKNAKGRCSIDAYDIAGNEVSYTLTCGERMMRSVTTFNGDSSSGSLVTIAGGKTTTTTIAAQRVGACP